MRTTGTLFLFVLALAGSALAQSQLVSKPSPAVSGPAYDLSVGYSHLRMAIASSKHANLDGVDATASVALSPRWGATVDSSYLRAADVLGTNHQAYMLSLLGGPVFYAVDRANTRVFVRAMGGAALVDGAVPITDTSYFHGWLVRPSFAFGGGVEHPISEQLAVRVNGDYLRTSFYDAAGAVQAQNNLRLTVSFVFRLRERQHR
jgi:outer membrane protein with beta-barrel domain